MRHERRQRRAFTISPITWAILIAVSLLVWWGVWKALTSVF